MIVEPGFATMLTVPANPVGRAGLALALGFALLALMVVVPVARGLRWLQRSSSSLGPRPGPRRAPPAPCAIRSIAWFPPPTTATPQRGLCPTEEA
jgi:hypothetical protein